MSSRNQASRCALFVLALPVVALPAPLFAQDPSRESFDVAIGLIQRELFDDAAKQLGRFLRDAPKHPLAPEARYRLGACEEKLGNKARAIDAYVAALEARDLLYRPECRYRLGKLWQEGKKFKDAAQQLAALVDEVEEGHYLRLPAAYALGECLRDAGEGKRAVEVFRQVGASDKDAKGTFGMPALYHAGFVLSKSGQHREAADTFAEAAKKWPQHEARAECLYLAAEACFAAEEWARAVTTYEAAIEAAGPHVAEARNGRAWSLMRLDRQEDAAKAFAELAKLHADTKLAVPGALEAGSLRWQLGQYQEAITTLEGVLGRKDLEAADKARALEVLGLAQLDVDRAKDARLTFQRALQGEIDAAAKARIAFNLGEATSELELWREAADAYGLASNAAMGVKDDALTGDALYGAVVALHELGEHQASVTMAGRIVDALPKHRLAIEARFARAEGLFALKNFDAAQDDYAKLPAGHDLEARASFKHAWCAYLGGRAAEAATRFEAVAASESPFAEEALSLAVLASYQAKDADRALVGADRYYARYKDGGAFLARTERVAAQVLAARDQLDAAATRVARAAAAEKDVAQRDADLLQVAELSFRRRDYEAARASYAKIAKAKDDVGAKALQGLAWCAFELGDDAACATGVEAALAHPAIGDGAASMLELVSSLHHRAGRFDEAEIAARSFLNRFPKHARAPELRYALGVALARRERHAEALEVFAALGRDAKARAALERPDRLDYELAWTLRKLGKEAEALAAFARVADASKDKELAGEARLHLGVAELGKLGAPSDAGKGGVDDASAERLLLAAEGRYRAQALYRLGFARFERGAFDAAAPLFERILALGADDAQSLYDEALFFAGECAYRRGDRQRARDAFVELLKRDPDGRRSSMARLHLGHCDLEDGRAAAAIASLEAWMQKNNDAPVGERARAALWLGRARQARKDHAAAVASYESATKLSDGPIGAEAQFRIGDAWLEAKQRGSAIDAWLKLTILYGHAEWVRKGLLEAGKTYLEDKQAAKAKKLLGEVVERFAESEEARQAKSLLDKLGQD